MSTLQGKSIYTWIKEQEIAYTQDIDVMENWNWNMKEHIRISMLFKHGKFARASNELATKNPNRNIIYPMLNLRYRAEDIDVRDVTPYVDEPNNDHLSFLIKKYHDEVYVKENKLDTFFDETKEEKIDLGGTLVRKGTNGPLYEPLDSIVFCDQTDMLSGPIAFKVFFSPDELYEMEKYGWGDTKKGANTTIEELITLAEESKQQDSQKGSKTKTPGKYIEIYRIHGSFPTDWLGGAYTQGQKEKYVRQMHICGFYKKKDGMDVGVTLYKAREYENPFKQHLSGKKIRNRALAYGGVEELFDQQIWTNYSEIQKKNLLDAASKIIPWTDDESFKDQTLKDMDNLEWLTLQKGSQIGLVPNGSPNIQLFNQWMRELEQHAQFTSGATDALFGKNPSSGSPFKLQQLVVEQGMGLHEYRRGRFATFIAEIYEDWIIPDIVKKLENGARFLATLSPDELQYVTDRIVDSEVFRIEKETILNGGSITIDGREALKQRIREQLSKKGNKYFLELFKGELKNVSVKVKINVAGKQKDLAGIVDKFTNILRFIFSTYNSQTGKFSALEDPKALKAFNKLIEYSGLDPIDFGYTGPVSPPQMVSPIPKESLPTGNLETA